MSGKKKCHSSIHKLEKGLISKNSSIPKFADIDLTDYRLSTEFDKEFIEQYDRVINSEDIEKKEEVKSESVNAPSYVGMEFGMLKDDHENLQFAKVKKELTDDDGVPVGTANNNPILDSRMFEVE